MEPEEFWSLGDYAIAGDLWAQTGRDVVVALDLHNKDVLDLATGTGIAAITAAQQGARSATGVDITPGLLSHADQRAQLLGLNVEWMQADMHQVPLPDDSADLVLSTFGLIFSPEPADALREALRLTRPGGHVVFSSWSPSGLFGQIRETLSAYFPEAPAPWHEDPEQIRALAGPGAEVDERWFTVTVDTPEEFVNLMEQHSAPIILGARSLGPQWEDARQALLETVRDHVRDQNDEAGNSHSASTRLNASYYVTTVPAA